MSRASEASKRTVMVWSSIWSEPGLGDAGRAAIAGHAAEELYSGTAAQASEPMSSTTPRVSATVFCGPASFVRRLHRAGRIAVVEAFHRFAGGDLGDGQAEDDRDQRASTTPRPTLRDIRRL